MLTRLGEKGTHFLINIYSNIYFFSWILKKDCQIFLKVDEMWIGQTRYLPA